MRQGNFINSMTSVVFSFCCFVILFVVLRWLMTGVSNLYAWNTSSVWRSLFGISFLYVDMVYFLFGILMYMYASIRFIGINKENCSVRSTNDTPQKLLTDGYYASTRHPMYGIFIIKFAAVFLALRSMNGIILTILFAISQYLNAYQEEKRILVPLFGNEYRYYTEKVQQRLLNKWEAFVLGLFLAFSLSGFI